MGTRRRRKGRTRPGKRVRESGAERGSPAIVLSPVGTYLRTTCLLPGTERMSSSFPGALQHKGGIINHHVITLRYVYVTVRCVCYV